jgi:hypothetical protein
MTSDRKIAANQKNATKSTGPKSALGKRRTRRNALRHGLSIGLGDDAAVVAEADLLAKSLPFVEEGGRNSLVLQLAEAELDLPPGSENQNSSQQLNLEIRGRAVKLPGVKQHACQT